MIPRAFITEWSSRVPWSNDEQIEQDLLLSRLIVEIANDPLLGPELVFRGGTCMHKLHLPSAFRYSEDLDYVRRTAGGIVNITRALTAIGRRLSMDVKTRMALYPKLFFRAPFEVSNTTMRIKIEINTAERTPAHDLDYIPFAVDSSWFSGHANVQTFSIAELMATKIRALYQRSKGRDLFDLWLGLHDRHINPADIVECFNTYRPSGYTSELAEKNLRAKLADNSFRNDLNPLVNEWPQGYDIDIAAELVIAEILARL